MTKQHALQQINQLADIIPMVYNEDNYLDIVDALDSEHAAQFIALVNLYKTL
jgi:hypothetical protein